ncbi:hypothetical protein CBL_00680 [Carabus blaptoides fortunei]
MEPPLQTNIHISIRVMYYVVRTTRFAKYSSRPYILHVLWRYFPEGEGNRGKSVERRTHLSVRGKHPPLVTEEPEFRKGGYHDNWCLRVPMMRKDIRGEYQIIDIPTGYPSRNAAAGSGLLLQQRSN